MAVIFCARVIMATLRLEDPAIWDETEVILTGILLICPTKL